MTDGANRSGDSEDRRSSAGLVRVLGAPLALAVLSAVGLVSALLGDGVWDLLSWFALALPVAVTVRYLVREIGVRVRATRSSVPERSPHLRDGRC
jgi:hypothetical protein